MIDNVRRQGFREDETAPSVELYQPFPVDALPNPVRRFVRATANSIGCDEAYVALPLLSALAGVIGNSRYLLVKPDWRVPAILWTCCVGESGCGKSPPFRQVMGPLRDMQRHTMKTHDTAVEAFERRRVKFDVALRAWKSKPEGEPPKKPEPPPTPRLVVADTTIEALTSVLEGNPRGILLARDELAREAKKLRRYIKNTSGD